MSLHASHVYSYLLTILADEFQLEILTQVSVQSNIQGPRDGRECVKDALNTAVDAKQDSRAPVLHKR